jgi:3'-5' exoribonuclease
MKAMVSAMRPGERMDSHFAVKSKRAPKEYKYGWMFEVRLADASGETTAKYWGPADRAAVQLVFDSFSSGMVVRVTGEVREFGNGLEIGVSPKGGDAITPLRAGDYAIEDLVGRGPVDREAMLADLRQLVESVRDPHLTAVLTHFFGKGGITEKFARTPASMLRHSNYPGGLLEHSTKVARICEFIATKYPSVDRDLLVTGALLHDIGKVRELELGTSIEVSDEGMFRGHIVIGEGMVSEAVAGVEGFPAILSLKLSHMMLAHHGRKEWGSPKEPQTAEALLLHLADMVDSQVFQYIRAKEESNTDEDWAWDKHFGQIYLK